MPVNFTTSLSATGSVSITTETQDVITAPAPIWLEASGHSGLAAFDDSGTYYEGASHEYTHIWTVNGSPLSAYSAPSNMVTGWNDANTAYGRRVALCLTDPGNYTIDLSVVDKNGVTATNSTSTITVQDPDTVYSGDDTIVVDLSGSFSGAPAGAHQSSTLADVRSEIETRSNPVRVLFKKGETYQDPDLVSNAGRLTHVGAWGTGADPIFNLNEDGTDGIRWRASNSDTQVTVEGIDFQGTWDAATETGRRGSPMDWITAATAKNFHLYKCSFSGVSLGIYHTGTGSTGHDLLVSDCVVTNWSGYGLLADNGLTGKIGVIGSRFAQKTDALHGGNKIYSWHNTNSPIRVEDFDLFYVAATDLYARTGWAGASLDNPCLRVNSSGNLDVDVNLERIVCEGGRRMIHMQGETAGVADNPGNYIIDKALLIASGRTHGAFVYGQFGGASYRNMIGIWTDVPNYDGNARHYLIDTESSNDQNGNASEPVRIYNNTLLSLIDSTNDAGTSASAVHNPTTNFTDVTEANNLIHVPDGTTPLTTYAPIDVATAVGGITPIYPGVRFGYEDETGTLASAVADSGTFAVAYSQLTRRDIVDDNGSTSATDQSYWTSRDSGDTDHRIVIDDGDTSTEYRAEDGDFSVSFDASEVTITNNSGVTWASGDEWVLRLDRKSYLDTDLPMLTTYANPSTVPLPRPITGSSAIGGASGLQAYDDFTGTARTKDVIGALEDA